MSAPARERTRRHHLPAEEWPHDPWDDPDATGALVIEPTRRSLRPVRAAVWTLGALAIVAILVAGSTGWWYMNQINPKGDPGPAVNFTVNPGETVESLSVRLQDEGIITNARVFRWYVRRQGGLELTPGYYALRPRDHMGNLMSVLRTPPEETYSSVTFPEGFTASQMANRLAEKVPRMLVSDFVKATTDGSVRSEFQPESVTSLEGLLFPDTYQVSNGESPGQVIQRMVSLMERVGRQEQIVEKGYVLGHSAYDVLIVASMIEREAKLDEDRPLIAWVIWNRLELGMPLQIDATLYYGQDPNLPFDQLKSIDSPYNTYLYAGLPPTPIANPGRASIEAAANPANNPPAGGAECKDVPKDRCLYLYYVLADEDGRHAFAVTLEQHEANVEKARAAGSAVITGSTRVAAVIGHPVAHSLSPALHNAAFAVAGADWVYTAFDVAPGDAGRALDAMRALGLGGLSVTMPHKQAVAAAVDVCVPAARALDSVNTVVRLADGRLEGHSTDGAGFVASLREAGCDPTGRRVAVLGAGAAARAVIDAVAREGAAEIVVINRSPDRALQAAQLAGRLGRVGTVDDVQRADIVVNATSIGMGSAIGDVESLPLAARLLLPTHVVADLVYHPLDTPLLVAARAVGAQTVDGLGMLVHQAALQQRLWLGVLPDTAVMRDAAVRELASRRPAAPIASAPNPAAPPPLA